MHHTVLGWASDSPISDDNLNVSFGSSWDYRGAQPEGPLSGGRVIRSSYISGKETQDDSAVLDEAKRAA